MSPLFSATSTLLILAGCAPTSDSFLGDTAPGARGAPVAAAAYTWVDVDADGDDWPDSLDCDDQDPTIHPEATEEDDGLDQDCDGWVDEDFLAEGDLVLTEINKQARFGGSVALPAGSWFELENVSDRDIDMSNWVIARENLVQRSFVVDPAAPVIVPAGGRAVFCESDAYEGSAVPWPLRCDYVWGDPTMPSTWIGTYHNNRFHLNSSKDRLLLLVEGDLASGWVMDEVAWTWEGTTPWPLIARFSMALNLEDIDATRNDDARAWCSTTASAGGVVSNDPAWAWYDTPLTSKDEYGTPGAVNYDCPTDPDWDGDGHTGAEDCDETDANVYLGAPEACDGVDQDCDGAVDDDPVDGLLLYEDLDDDHFGSAVEGRFCTLEVGWALVSGDCDDGNAAIVPGAIETCDGVDQDCDGEVDEAAADMGWWYQDGDADGWGGPSGLWSCSLPEGHVAVDGDCNDADPGIHPEAVDACDGVDQDCDAVEEPLMQWDADLDGYGDPTATLWACAGEAWATWDDTDCDDTDATVNPGATESCDGDDEDCDGMVDDDAVDRVLLHADADGDGWGDPLEELVCPGAGWVAEDSDCDDADPEVWPGAPELRDVVDNDCDDWVDEGAVAYGELVFTEVVRQARFGGLVYVPEGSWVEVYNASSLPVDLGHWQFSHTGPWVTRSIQVDPADDLVLDPGDHLVICDTDHYEDGAGVAWPLFCDVVWTDDSLPASYEGLYANNKLNLAVGEATIELSFDGELIDGLSWAWDETDGYWPRVARYSMSLDPAYLDADANDLVDAWCSTTEDAAGLTHDDEAWRWWDTSGTTKDEYGTPGYANYDCPVGPDGDDDGVEDALDCDPTDPDRFVGNPEVECDGVDQDCDGVDSCAETGDFVLSFDGSVGAWLAGTVDFAETPMSVELWVKVDPTSISGTAVVGSHSCGWYNGWFIDQYQNDESSLVYTHYIWGWGAASGPVAYDSWHHVALVADGSSRVLYVDGAPAFTTVDGYLGPSGGEIALARHGKACFDYAPGFIGQIDDVRIWNVARTEAELVAGMTGTLTGMEAGLYAWIDPVADTTGTVPDRSPNGHDLMFDSAYDLVVAGDH